jgi:toxin ParE1/3/4
VASYRLVGEAHLDLGEIGRYTQQTWGPTLRDGYLKALTRAFELLAENPGVGRSRNDIRPGLRSFLCRRHLIFYREGSGGVEIIRLLHASRDVDRVV